MFGLIVYQKNVKALPATSLVEYNEKRGTRPIYYVSCPYRQMVSPLETRARL
jgi:hypothetical protein